MIDLRALDWQCATLLGYTVYHYDKDYQENCYYLLMDGDWNAVLPFRAGERKTEAEAWADAPRFSEDEGAARLLEDAVETQGKRNAYIRALTEALAPIVFQDAWADCTDANYDALWSLLRASPSQRARAFVEVFKQ